ncbi:MAG: BMC domain-containing protein [Chloroflexi bacterium]|nr:BMC domain-containing protein [Chloroflexota bacterium]
MLEPALALIEFSSIATGIQAADAMAKRAPIDLLRSGTVQPGKYLVLIGGQVADVEEALSAGRSVGESCLVDSVFLPQVHPDVVEAIAGIRVPHLADALGIIETTSVAASIRAADAAIKGAQVKLVEIRLADGLGGKGIVLFSGRVADVETAASFGLSVLGKEFHVNQIVIPQLHPEMWENLAAASPFEARVVNQL